MRLASCFLLAALAAHASDMVTIPAGEFTMGRMKMTPDDKTNMRPHVLLDDTPARKVKMPSFRMDTHEATNAEYAAFAQATKRRVPHHWIGGTIPEGKEKHPVYNVSWDDAKAYCESHGKRLPTEAEWERAARGGLESQDFPNGDKITAKDARHNVGDGPTNVGSFAANGFGLFDMAGNVAEWTADWFALDYYKRGENENPQGPKEGLYRVVRGGAWSDPPKRITVFFRNWVRANQRTPNIGIRCAQ
jgi:formylglycine-generating enzyme required for sulfatase activity